MAVWKKTCSVFPCCHENAGRQSCASRNGLKIRSKCSAIRTHLCTVALSLTLFSSVRLPRESFRYGAVPYLVVYSLWLLVVGLATTLLQLATGQLSHQDPVGVWRAVPIMRGVGHLKLFTSYICCVYNMLLLALAAAYLIWIGKDTFPLRACTRIQMTPDGYVNKINASECFNSTFLSSFPDHPQYFGIMALILFILWFFVPLFLYALAKSLRVTLSILAPIIIVMATVLASYLARTTSFEGMLVSCEHWSVFFEPNIWFSSLVQALMTTQILSGYLTSAGGTVYDLTDIRWISASAIACNIVTGWLWVFLWQSIGGTGEKDTSFVSILILIYQASLEGKRLKQWPLLAYGIVFASGIVTILTLLYPIYDRFQRLTGDKWKLIVSIGSAIGTFLSLAILIKAVDIGTVLDDLIVPVLIVFSTSLEVVGFVFIYGCQSLRLDIEFLTASKTSWLWVVIWCFIPFVLLGTLGWWLKVLLRSTWGQPDTLWPLGSIFVGILIILCVSAAVAVAKEEQFNLASKIASAFRPSRLWGPEDPSVRYNWMVERYSKDRVSYDNDSIGYTKYNDWLKDTDTYQRTFDMYTKDRDATNGSSLSSPTMNNFAIPRSKIDVSKKFMSPNVCIANDKLDSRLDCNCNRHFTLNVPYLRKNESTTSL